MTTKTFIDMARWGKDHWSTLTYLETLAVDNKGMAIPNLERMRCDINVHPGLGNSANHHFPGKAYPTRLKDGPITDHDDWSCVEDMEAAGLVEWKGTGINPIIVFTDLGMKVAAALRVYKAKDGNFHQFEYKG